MITLRMNDVSVNLLNKDHSEWVAEYINYEWGIQRAI